MTNAQTAAKPIRLVRGDAVAEFHPQIGAALSRFAVRGVEIMRATPGSAIAAANVRQMACYPLVPYSNRIGEGKLLFGHKTHQLRLNFGNEVHSIHGVGWQRAWKIEAQTADSLTLSLNHSPDADWPFRFDVVQECRLLDGALVLRLRVTSRDDAPMPVGLGFHPFFPITPETTLQAEWSGRWEMGDDKLPTEWKKVSAETDFALPRLVRDWKVDHCFTDWKQRATLAYSKHRLVITASGDAKNLICFAPNDGRNFIALEPVTNINNAFALAARGVANTGMRVLGRGDSVEMSMTISVEEPTASGSGAKS